MIQPQSRQLRRASPLVALPILLLLDLGIGAAYGQQTAKPEGDRPSEKAPGQEFTPRGQRAAREIKYSDWRKFCFKTPGTNLVCRTTISGTFETGQSAVRIDLIEREGDKITIDQGTAHRIPYVWCLTNTCIAADPADPGLIKEMESGQKLVLEVVDSGLLTVSTSPPLNQFATVRQGPPTQTFEQAIDE